MLKKWILILFLLFLVLEVPRPLGAAPGKFDPESVENSPTIQLETNFILEGNNKQAYQLLKNLPLTCTVIRMLQLENFKARRIGDNYFQADDGAGLNGFLYYHKLTPKNFKATGGGTYTTSRFSLDLRGRASTSINFERLNPKRTAIGATISIQVTNRLLHYTGRMLAPFIRRIARSKTDNLKAVARNFFIRAEKNKDVIQEQLYKIDAEMGKRWSEIF